MEQTNQNDTYLQERYSLAMERIEGILEEKTVSAPFCIYFQAVAKFLLETKALREKLVPEKAEAYTLEEWQQLNHEMYADILRSTMPKALATRVCGGDAGRGVQESF